MTLEELQAAGSTIQTTITVNARAKKTSTETRRREGVWGRPLEVEITPDNFKAFGLTIFPGKLPAESLETITPPTPTTPIPSQPDYVQGRTVQVYFPDNPKPLKVEYEQMYGSGFFREALLKAAPESLSASGLEELFKYSSRGKDKVTGRELVRLIHLMNNSVVLNTKTIELIAEKVDAEPDEVKAALGNLKEVGKMGPMQYIPTDQVQQVVSELREYITGTKTPIPEVIKIAPRSLEEMLQPAKPSQRERTREEKPATPTPEAAPTKIIPPQIQAPTQAQPPKQKRETPMQITIDTKQYDVYPEKAYTPKEATEILQHIHSGVFTIPNVERIAEAVFNKKELSGKEIAELTFKYQGGLIDLSSSSTGRRLEQELNIPAEEVGKMLMEDPALARYINEIPGVPGRRYLLKRDLPKITTYLDSKRPVQEKPAPVTIQPTPTPEPPTHSNSDPRLEIEAALTEGLNRLSGLGIRPRGRVYDKMLDVEIFDLRTPETVRRSIAVYEEKMAGCSFLDFNFVRTRLPGAPRWDEFKSKYMDHLVKAGIAKEMVSECLGSEKSAQLYVLAPGKTKADMARFWNLDPQSI